jgi:plastocyanin
MEPMMIRHLGAVGFLVACSTGAPRTVSNVRPQPSVREPAAYEQTTIIGPAGATSTPSGKLTPTGEKAASLREAADLLDKAQSALANGNRNLADQLFSTAELLVGQEAVQSIASIFRAGAPPRVTTPTTRIDMAAPPQPKAVGSSEQDDAESRTAPPRAQGSLSGTLMLDGQRMAGAYGLVTLEPERGKWVARSPKRRTIEQRDREFLPRVMAVPVGSTVLFPNFDNVFHNVFSTTPVSAFDLGIYKAGEAREYTFQKEGIVRIACNLHAGMSAYVAVVSAPYYVVTDDSGKFEFKHLPPGSYRLKAWTERSKAPVSQAIAVKQGANTVQIGVAGDAPTGKSPDKFGGKRD